MLSAIKPNAISSYTEFQAIRPRNWIKNGFQNEQATSYRPATVACEVTDYTFLGNHGERWPFTRISIGAYQLNDGRKEIRRLFKIESRDSTARVQAASLNDDASEARVWDAVDFFGKADIKNIDGAQPDGRIVQTMATPSVSKVDVLFYGNHAYLREPGRFWGYRYYKVDLNTFDRFFVPTDKPAPGPRRDNVVPFLPAPATRTAQP